MKSPRSDRRQFLERSAALAGLAVGAIKSAGGQTEKPENSESPGTKDTRAYGVRSRFVTSARGTHQHERRPEALGHHAFLTPLQDQHAIITPSGLHFWEDHGYAIPDIDPQQHRLLIHGMVDRPLVFTVEELMRLPSVSRVYFVECNSNSRPVRGSLRDSLQQVHGLTSCSEWTGVPLSLLLKEAGVRKGASWLVAEGAEAGKYTKSLLLEKGLDDALVAYGQNGEPVRPENGYPLRLMVPGWEGNFCVKWLRRIKVVDQPYMAKWESASNANFRPDGKSRWFIFEMGPKSVITRPCPEYRVPGRGFFQIRGLAWSGGGVIRKVEVSTDGGQSWKDAQIQEPVHRKAHTRFSMDWNWKGQECVLLSRCTDERGTVQPSLVELAKSWEVSPDYFRSPESSPDHFNAMQPWKVSPDGSVRNALYS